MLNPFFSALGREPDGYVEVHIVSGIAESSLKAAKAANEAGARILFANVDLDGARDDALVVNSSGVVFYGNIDSGKQISEEKLRVTALSIQLESQMAWLNETSAGNGLQLTIHPEKK